MPPNIEAFAAPPCMPGGGVPKSRPIIEGETMLSDWAAGCAAGGVVAGCCKAMPPNRPVCAPLPGPLLGAEGSGVLGDAGTAGANSAPERMRRARGRSRLEATSAALQSFIDAPNSSLSVLTSCNGTVTAGVISDQRRGLLDASASSCASDLLLPSQPPMQASDTANDIAISTSTTACTKK